MKLAKLVSVFLKEDITQTLFLETRSECKWPTEHATMLKDMFDKEDGIFTHQCSFCYKISRKKLVNELPDKIMHSFVQNCKAIYISFGVITHT